MKEGEKVFEEIPEVIMEKRLECQEASESHVMMYSLRYHSDDCEVEGIAAFPEDVNGQKWPALIFNRGGNREFASLTPEKLCKYAACGYATFGSQYRGNCGGTGKEEFGGSDINDVIHLIDIALQLPCVRKEGVYMLGRSRGGMMTYMACALDERIRAAAVCAGLADSVMMYETREESMKLVYHELVGGSPEECPEAFRRRSAVCWADKIEPPILICQGTSDWRVIPEQAYKMDRALEDAGKEHRLIVYENADHSLEGTPYLDDVIQWFQEHPL